MLILKHEIGRNWTELHFDPLLPNHLSCIMNANKSPQAQRGLVLAGVAFSLLNFSFQTGFAQATTNVAPEPLHYGDKVFRPGAVWFDDKGVAINAHGGGILFHDGTYYWFGEHKVEGTNGNTAQVGVHVYSSTNLYGWKDEGIALAVSDNETSEIAKGCILERPKVIFNGKTKKFVMWF